ncbi:MAG: hypothetical protein KBT46_07285, partial [Ruminococcus sp.]|nr:hypothetical protein [Candidatus Copronaster equi]
MNKKPNKNQKKLMTLLPYILIPLLFVTTIAFATSDTKRAQETEYYQIIQHFDKNEVEKFSLNLSSGSLKYKLRNKEGVKEYKVPSVNIFVEDVNEIVRENNQKAKSEKELVKYEYISGSTGSWLINLLPSAIIGIVLVVL